MKRINSCYGALREMVWQRDVDCWEAYKRYFALPLVGGDPWAEPPETMEGMVLHHVDHRAVLISMNREDNVIMLPPEIHQIVHDRETKAKRLLKAYLTCGEVEEWRALHEEEIRIVEEKTDEALGRMLARRCTARRRGGA